jgi:hypothetical protein
MSSLKKRIQKLEENAPVNQKPVFWGNGMQNWTEEQKEVMLKKYPACKFFMIPLSPHLPYEWARMNKADQEFTKDMASLVRHDADKEKRTDEAIRRWVGREELLEGDERLLEEFGVKNRR